MAVAGNYSSNCTPSLGTSICCRSGPKKAKNKTKKKEEEEEEKESNPNLKAGLSMYSAGIARMLHPKGVETNTWAGSKAKPFRLPIGFVKSFIIPRS